MQHEKSETWKNCSTKKTWKVKDIAEKDKSATWRECNTKKVKHENSVTREKCKWEIVKHEILAIRKKCNMKRRQHEKSVPWKYQNMKRLRHGKITTWKKYSDREKFRIKCARTEHKNVQADNGLSVNAPFYTDIFQAIAQVLQYHRSYWISNV